MIVLVTLLLLLIQERELINIALLYQLPVILSAFWWGRWPSYFTAFSGILVFDFIFIPPTFTLSVDDVRHVWSFITFLVVAFVIGGRTEFLRNEAITASQRERSTEALYQFSREIAAITDLGTIINKLATQVSDTLCQRTRVLLPDDSGQLIIRADHIPASVEDPDGEPLPTLLSVTEQAVAKWTYTSGQSTSRSTAPFPDAEYLYFPMTCRESVVGLLAVRINIMSIAPEQSTS
jgi:two-component system sensor histidine kinase KdpD